MQQQSLLQLLLFLACITLAIRPCMQGFSWCFSPASNVDQEDSGVASPQFFVGRTRNVQIKAMHHQVVTTEQEIKSVRKQLAQALAASAERDVAITSADSMVKVLQHRSSTEQAARTQAQLGLAEKSSALQSCYTRKGALGSQIDTCTSEIAHTLLARSSHVEM